METETSPRRAVVTGAAGGIGSAIARRLVGDGLLVAGIDNDDSALRQLSDDLGDGFHPSQVDLLDDVAVAGKIESFGADGGIDVVVNAAGVISRRDIDTLDLAEWDRVLGVNLRAPFVVVKATLPYLSEGSVVVNITSIQARVAGAELVHYATSKAGLEHLTKGLAVALGPRGIRVVAVAPGTTATAMNAQERSDPNTYARYVSGVPLGRIVDPAEIAAAVAFVTGPEASSITGTTILVDGGRLASR